MIFKETWSWVLGTSPHTEQPKTQTRRRGKRRYKVGGVYAVQPDRGQKAKGYIKILAAWEEYAPFCRRPLDAEMTSQDVLEEQRQLRKDLEAEGFTSLIDFQVLWRSLHGLKAWSEPCRAYEFERVMRDEVVRTLPQGSRGKESIRTAR